MTDGWIILEKYLEKKIDLEIKLAELFILTISAGIVVISLSQYKWIILSILMQIVSLTWILIDLISNLRKKKDEKSVNELEKSIQAVIINLGVNQLIPLIFYIASILIMGIIVLLPLIKK